VDRHTLVSLPTEQVATTLTVSPWADEWAALCELAGEDAAQLLSLCCQLTPPERVAELGMLEARQIELGAGFLGMLPDQIPEDLPIPKDVTASLALAQRLAQIRNRSVEAVKKAMPQYPLAFMGQDFDAAPPGEVPATWNLTIDAGGILSALDAFDAGGVTHDAALAIANMSAFVEMMRHRRELGYVPEPLIDADGLAWCLMHAASDDPIDALWKWLHPQNLFDLSDLYAHRARYRRLIDQLVDGDALANAILSRLAPYAPANASFEDRFAFAVGWGIRGWATEASGGLNIEHVKDDIAHLLETLVHETYHRLQAHVALAHPGMDKIDFDRITSYPFEQAADARLYRALAYVMLEGSATYVAAVTGPTGAHPAAWKNDMTLGLDLIERVEALPADADDEATDGLLNEGLRSNGPFYGLGAQLSANLVASAGPQALGVALIGGAPTFVLRALAGREAAPMISHAALEHIKRLDQLIAMQSAH